MDDLLEQPYKALSLLAARRQVYEELEGELVISLDLDDDDASDRLLHTSGGPVEPGHLQLA